jgi:hypothetical protein
VCRFCGHRYSAQRCLQDDGPAVLGYGIWTQVLEDSGAGLLGGMTSTTTVMGKVVKSSYGLTCFVPSEAWAEIKRTGKPLVPGEESTALLHQVMAGAAPSKSSLRFVCIQGHVWEEPAPS